MKLTLTKQEAIKLIKGIGSLYNDSDIEIVDDLSAITEPKETAPDNILEVFYEDLDKQIKDCNFSWFNSDINSKHFKPVNKKGKKEFKVFHFNKEISSEDTIKEIENDGYKPADIYDLLAFHKQNTDNREFIVALGSVWRDSDDDRDVPCLLGDGHERELDLDWFDGGWNANYRFLAVRN